MSLRSKLEDFVTKIYPLRVDQKTGEMVYGKPEKLSVCDALSEIMSSQDARFVNDDFIRIIRNRLVAYKVQPYEFIKFARLL